MPRGRAVGPERNVSGSEVQTSGHSSLSSRLLTWFDQAKRDLPWRRDRDPYAIWVSEVMLQQTRVETVRTYYERWMRTLPTILHLADASEPQVLELWQGLGYYSRARRLREGARYVRDHHGAKLPSSAAALLDVPGIGPYSAGAIASIAFGQAVPAIDGNVTRVLSRLLGLRGLSTTAAHRTEVQAGVSRLMSEERAGDFNQALMELGATVCTPKVPSCTTCPWVRDCKAFQQGIVHELPETAQRARPTAVDVSVLLIEREGRRFELVELSGQARWWAGLMGLPCVENGTNSGGAFAELAPRDPRGNAIAGPLDPQELLGRLGLKHHDHRLLTPLVHAVTRYRLKMQPIWVRSTAPLDLGEGSQTLSESELRKVAIAAPFRKILDRYFREAT
jgi:A/G-specific adenine glycosylase